MNSEQAMRNKVPQRYFASDLTDRVFKTLEISKLSILIGCRV